MKRRLLRGRVHLIDARGGRRAEAVVDRAGVAWAVRAWVAERCVLGAGEVSVIGQCEDLDLARAIADEVASGRAHRLLRVQVP
jgi:hypothetical protein